MKDYLLYDVEDFITDESYLRFYFRENEEDTRFWTEWIGLHPEKLDVIISANDYIDAFSIRLSESEFQKEQQRFDHALKALSSNTDFDQVTSKYPAENITGSRYTPRIIGRRLAWAAVFIMMATGAVLYVAMRKDNAAPVQNATENLAQVEKYVPKGEQARITLPDGSEVQLNADSRLIYPSKFNGAIREVKLTGEAFFHVKHDSLHPFHVLSGNLVTTVLGTSFNVRCYPDEKLVKVALVSGKVRMDRVVDPVNKKEPVETLILSPSEMGVFDKYSSSLEKGRYDNKEETGWRQGIIVFKDAGFDDIAACFRRVFNVRLVNASPKSEFKFRGTFTYTSSAEEIIKSICLSKKLSYTINGDIITIQ